MPVSWMIQQAKQARISSRTLQRARMAVGVIAMKLSMTGAWTWMLPSTSMAPFGSSRRMSRAQGLNDRRRPARWRTNWPAKTP